MSPAHRQLLPKGRLGGAASQAHDSLISKLQRTTSNPPPVSLTKPTPTNLTSHHRNYTGALILILLWKLHTRAMSRRAPNPAAERAAQNTATIKSLLKLEPNKVCADCKRNKRK